MLPEADVGGHFSDAVAVIWVVEEVVLFIGVGVEVKEFALVTCTEGEFPAVA